MKIQTVWCTVSLDCDESQIEAVKGLFPKVEEVRFFRYRGEGRLHFKVPAAKAVVLNTLFPSRIQLSQFAELRVRKPVRRRRKAHN